MLQGNQLKFQRGAAAKTEGEDRNNDGENRHHAVTVRLARANLQCFSALWKFEQGQDKVSREDDSPLARCSGASRPSVAHQGLEPFRPRPGPVRRVPDQGPREVR
jgi:hypothetical protein